MRRAEVSLPVCPPMKRKDHNMRRAALVLQSSFMVCTFLSSQTHTFTGGIDTAWVRHYGSGLAPLDAGSNAVAVDQGGNVYVTGWSHSSSTAEDYATIKYNSSGDTVWVRRYNGPGDSSDSPAAIAVDANGNVYVTGGSYGSSASYDYATIKYSSLGDTVWVRRYNGPGNSHDQATSLAVDVGGNVYVTGRSAGSSTYEDYATIKYNSSGDTVWVRRYNGPGNSDDFATSLAVDASGNVYVTGRSAGSSTYYDYATIKYSSSGDTVWVRRYNGPGNSDDFANALAVDASGNVHVTGGSYSSSTSADYATIKYNSSGDTVWVRRYDGPANDGDWAASLAVDASGNVYVTGGSYGSSSDYATIKYNSSGDTAWVRRFTAPEYSDDWATSLAVDASGNVYVTGTIDRSSSWRDAYCNHATIKYNSSGDTVWVRWFTEPEDSDDWATSLAVDASGNVYVTGRSTGSSSTHDYATIKYASSGETLWVRRYNGQGNSYDVATSLAVDAGGNVYVTGRSYGSSTQDDYATIKYNSSGDAVWVKRYDGPANGSDCATSLAVDAGGNVYVTGRSYGSSTQDDYATIKYNSSGDAVWVRRYNGPGNSYDFANALAVDASGNVYVTGGSYGSSNDLDYATIKYSSLGDTVWVRRYNGPGNSHDQASSLAVDVGGNVYVTGRSAGSSTYDDYATIKYNSSGDAVWVRRYSGPGDSSDYAAAIAVDANGNVYVTGWSFGSGTNEDYGTIKYSSSGDTVWVRRYNGPGNSHDQATSLAVDAGGNVYVTGGSAGSSTYEDYATIKYSSSGDPVWVRRYDGLANGDDCATSLAVDASGNVYVTGCTYEHVEFAKVLGIDGPRGGYKAGWSSGEGDGNATIKYDDAGNQMWLAQYTYAGGGSTPVGLKLDAQNNVYVAGTSSWGGWVWGGGIGEYVWTPPASIYAVIRYNQIATSVDQVLSSLPKDFSLSQNYPNPFNPATVISYHVPLASRVSLTVFDLLGREVAVLVNEEKPSGSYTAQWNAAGFASGIYLVRMQAGSFVDTKKIVLMK